MSKIYIYSNIGFFILALIALIFSVLNIIVKENFEEVSGCPRDDCVIISNSITAKTSTFNRIKVKTSNQNIKINDLGTLNLNSANTVNLETTNANIQSIENFIDFSENDVTFGDNASLNFKSPCNITSDIFTTNLTTSFLICDNANFSNITTTNLTGKNITITNNNITNATFTNGTGSSVFCQNISFTNVNFNSLQVSDYVYLTNPSAVSLITKDMSLKSITDVFGSMVIDNFFSKKINSNDMYSSGTKITATNINFTNMNTSISDGLFLKTTNLTTSALFYFKNFSASNIVGGTFSMTNITAKNINTQSLTSNIDYSTTSDISIKNLTCTLFVSDGKIDIDDKPLSSIESNLASNNINFSYNKFSYFLIPLTFSSGVNKNTCSFQVNHFLKEIGIVYGNNPYSAMKNTFLIESTGFNSSVGTIINFTLGNSADSFDPNLYLGGSFKFLIKQTISCINPYEFKIINKIPDYKIHLLTNKNLYDSSTKISTILNINESEIINIRKRDSFEQSITMTCVDYDSENKVLKFIILPI